MKDLVFLGHVAKDIIEVDGKQVISAGGGVYYGGHAALRLGRSVAVVTRCRKEDRSLLTSLEDAGAEVHCTFSTETSGIHNIYDDPTMETRRCIPLGFAGKITTNEIPPDLDASFFVISPIIAGEIGMEMLGFLQEKKKGKTCLDVQGFVRVREGGRLVFKDWKEKREGLATVSILKVDHAEARSLTGERELRPALEKIGSWGPGEILLTHNKGITAWSNGELSFLPWKNKSMDGRTGRGDTAFASYVASRLEFSPEKALEIAAAVTSLKMERPGPIQASLDEILAFKNTVYGSAAAVE